MSLLAANLQLRKNAGLAARGFTLCVQWHPEWKASTKPVSSRLLRAFGEACRVFRDRHKAPQPSEER